jgi:hypothetical protein
MSLQKESEASILPQVFGSPGWKQSEYHNNCSPYYVAAYTDEKEPAYMDAQTFSSPKLLPSVESIIINVLLIGEEEVCWGRFGHGGDDGSSDWIGGGRLKPRFVSN